MAHDIPATSTGRSSFLIKTRKADFWQQERFPGAPAGMSALLIIY